MVPQQQARGLLVSTGYRRSVCARRLYLVQNDLLIKGGRCRVEPVHTGHQERPALRPREAVYQVYQVHTPRGRRRHLLLGRMACLTPMKLARCGNSSTLDLGMGGA